MKLFKLIIEDLISSDEVKYYEEYKIYSMGEFEDMEDIQRLSPQAKFAEDFNSENAWFKIDKNIIMSITDKELAKFINDHEDKLIKIHDLLSNDNEANNVVETRTEMLKKYVIKEDEIEDLDERELIYQDVDIESIAEILTEVSLVNLKAQLGYYGLWQIIECDGMNYLLGN